MHKLLILVFLLNNTGGKFHYSCVSTVSTLQPIATLCKYLQISGE